MIETTSPETIGRGVTDKVTEAKERETQNHPRSSPEERKMVYRLAEHIDENGRYNDALKPMALAYAAAKGINEYEAKTEIDAKFERETGSDMKSYLEQHRLDRGLSVDNSRGR